MININNMGNRRGLKVNFEYEIDSLIFNRGLGWFAEIENIYYPVCVNRKLRNIIHYVTDTYSLDNIRLIRKESTTGNTYLTLIIKGANENE